MERNEVDEFTRRAIESYRGDDFQRTRRQMMARDPEKPYGNSGQTCGEILRAAEHREEVAEAALSRLPQGSGMCRIEIGKHTSYIHFPNLSSLPRHHLAIHMDVELFSNEDRQRQRQESVRLLEYLASLIPGCVIEDKRRDGDK